MEQFKRAKIIILNSNKSNIFKHDINNKLHLFNEERKDIHSSTSTPQHLYIISDDEIKSRDWFINELNQLWQHNGKVQPYKGSKKVIATTDTSLVLHPTHYSDDTKRAFHTNEYLPQLSQQFIEKYIEFYNKGKIIVDVLVEYHNLVEDLYNTKHLQTINDSQSYLKTCKLISSTIKVNFKDNTITIKRLKDTWNRKEVVDLLKKALQVDFNESANDKLFPSYFNWDKWIEENL